MDLSKTRRHAAQLTLALAYLHEQCAAPHCMSRSDTHPTACSSPRAPHRLHGPVSRVHERVHMVCARDRPGAGAGRFQEEAGGVWCRRHLAHGRRDRRCPSAAAPTMPQCQSPLAHRARCAPLTHHGPLRSCRAGGYSQRPSSVAAAATAKMAEAKVRQLSRKEKNEKGDADAASPAAVPAPAAAPVSTTTTDASLPAAAAAAVAAAVEPATAPAPA